MGLLECIFVYLKFGNKWKFLEDVICVDIRIWEFIEGLIFFYDNFISNLSII